MPKKSGGHRSDLVLKYTILFYVVTQLGAHSRFATWSNPLFPDV